MRRLLAVLSLVVMFAAGCNRSGVPASQPATPVAERGPFKLYANATPTDLMIGDSVTFEIRFDTPDDIAVAFPTPDELGKSFDIRRVERDDPQPGAAGGLTWRQRYRLEPLMSGSLEIPALTVRYGPAAVTSQPAASQPSRPAAGQPASHLLLENELSTNSIALVVKSVLTSQDSVNAPREITGVLTPPREPLKPWQIAAIAAGVLAAGVLGHWAVRAIRRRLAAPPPPIAPEIWALQELGKLSGQRWIETNRAREFYYRLTEIVRQYIERKFAVAAPEMTTDEFLNALARDAKSLPLDKQRLREFLMAGDLVKYAALTPGADEAEGSLSTARSFIHSSAAAAEQAARAAAAAARQTEAAA